MYRCVTNGEFVENGDAFVGVVDVVVIVDTIVIAGISDFVVPAVVLILRDALSYAMEYCDGETVECKRNKIRIYYLQFIWVVVAFIWFRILSQHKKWANNMNRNWFLYSFSSFFYPQFLHHIPIINHREE